MHISGAKGQAQPVKDSRLEKLKAQGPKLLTVLPYSNNSEASAKAWRNKKKTAASMINDSTNKKALLRLPESM